MTPSAPVLPNAGDRRPGVAGEPNPAGKAGGSAADDSGHAAEQAQDDAACQRAEQAPGKHVPKRAQPAPRQLRPRTSEDIANTETAEQLALRIWSAIVAEKALSGMSALMD